MGLCSALICVKRAHLAALGVCEANAIHIDVLSASARPITVLWFTAAMLLHPAVLSSTIFQERGCSTGAPAQAPPVGVPPSSVGPAEGTTLQGTSV